MIHKILIAESVDEKVLADFTARSGFEFDYAPDISVTELSFKIKGYDGLFVRPKQVTADAIANADRLKLVIRGGAGVNSIALDECKKRGIIVANTPGLNSDATAEFTFALLMNLQKQLVRSDAALKAGHEPIPEDFMGFELKGKKLGIIGYGNIGKRVEKIAGGFGMETSVFRRGDDLKNFLGQQHDVISLHVPLTEQTKHILGEDEFKLMKHGVIIINTARPQLIHAKALLEAADAGIISGFGIDGDNDLVKPFLHEKGIVTHHIADATYEAQANITKQALKQFVQFFEEGLEVNRVV